MTEAKRRHRHRRGIRRALRRAPTRLGGPVGDCHRGGPRCGRYLVLEPLSGRAMRRRKCRLLLLFRRSAAAGLDSGANASPPSRRFWPICGTWPTASICAVTIDSASTWSVPPSTRTTVAGMSTRRPGTTYAAQFLLCATGCLSAVNRPNIPGARGLLRRGVLHGSVAARGPRSARQAGRPDRHRFVRDPGGADHRGSGREPGGIPAIRELHHPDAQPALVGRGTATDPGAVSRASPGLGLRSGGHTARHLPQERRRHRTRGAS